MAVENEGKHLGRPGRTEVAPVELSTTTFSPQMSPLRQSPTATWFETVLPSLHSPYYYNEVLFLIP